MKAVGYVRVSTTRQAEEGLSLAEQERRVREHIEAQGWELKDMYVERGVTGRRDDRPELIRMLSNLDGVERLVIPKLDRLGRSNRHLAETFELLQDRGIELISLHENIDSSSTGGRLVRGMFAVLAEFESDLISERVRSVSGAHARAGKFRGGPRPFGYQVKDGKLIPHPEEAIIVRRMFDEAAAGKPMRRIAIELNAAGHVGPMGGEWSTSAVANRLRLPLYIGKVRLHDELYDGEHDAIIEPALFAQVGQLLGSRAYSGSGRKPTRHLFKYGFLRCGLCDAAMRPMQRERYKRTDIYRCACQDMPSVPRENLDRAVIDFLTNEILDRPASRRELAEAGARRVKQAEVDVRSSEASLAKARKRRERLQRYLQDGDLGPGEWRTQDAALEAEESTALAVLAEARAVLAVREAAQGGEGLAEALARIRGAVEGRQDEASLEAVRALLGQVFVHFTVAPVRSRAIRPESPTFDHRGQTFAVWGEFRAEWEEEARIALRMLAAT